MTTKECSEKFKINVSDVRNSAKKGFIPQAYKSGLFWVIPDDIVCVVKEKDIKYLLKKIIFYKNNKYVFCSERKYNKLKKVFELLQEIDLLDGFDVTKNMEDALKETFVTDKGLSKIFIKSNESINLNININNNISLLSIG